MYLSMVRHWHSTIELVIIQGREGELEPSHWGRIKLMPSTIHNEAFSNCHQDRRGEERRGEERSGVEWILFSSSFVTLPKFLNG
jgi:hypothetical protein